MSVRDFSGMGFALHMTGEEISGLIMILWISFCISYTGDLLI